MKNGVDERNGQEEREGVLLNFTENDAITLQVQ